MAPIFRDLAQKLLAPAFAHCKTTLVDHEAAVALGQWSRQTRPAGEALHIMQDWYAHSNFCEIAINQLLDARVDSDGEVLVDTDGNIMMSGEEYDTALKKH